MMYHCAVHMFNGKHCATRGLVQCYACLIDWQPATTLMPTKPPRYIDPHTEAKKVYDQLRSDRRGSRQ